MLGQLSIKKLYKGLCLKVIYVWVAMATHSAWANLPAVEQGGHKLYKDDGNLIKVVSGYIAQGGKVLALAISVLGFIWVSYSALAKFNQCRTGKAEWAELGLLTVAAAAILVFITLLLTQTESVMVSDFTQMQGETASKNDIEGLWGRLGRGEE